MRIRVLVAVHTSVTQQAPQVEPSGARLCGVKCGDQRRHLRSGANDAHRTSWWGHAGGYMAGWHEGWMVHEVAGVCVERACAIEPFSTARLILTRSW